MKILDERGGAYAITIVAMAAILAFSSLVIDIGLAFIEKSKLNNAVDAAALAGAQELPSNPNKAVDVAKDYCLKNNIPSTNVNISISENNTKLNISAKKQVNFVLAKIFGVKFTNVNANVGAVVRPANAVYNGIRPFAVEQGIFIYGQEVTLKEGAGGGTTGNYGAIALKGNGASIFEDNIKYGYSGKLQVGDIIYTEPGNISGPTLRGVKFITDTDNYTFDNYDRSSLRLWIIPVIDSLDVAGKSGVTIVGFAQFFVENATQKSGHAEIYGRFIEFTTNADISENQTYYGLKGVKLIQ